MNTGMLELILAILGGTTASMAVVGYLGKLLLENILKKEFEQFQKETKRELALNSRQDEYKKVLSIRQLDALEDMWSLFVSSSLSGDKESMIIDPKTDDPKIDVKKAEEFVALFNSKFSNKSGLYLPKSTRELLHQFRNYVIENLIDSKDNNQKQRISGEQLSQFKILRTKARIAIREAVGSYDITIAKDEFVGG